VTSSAGLRGSPRACSIARVTQHSSRSSSGPNRARLAYSHAQISSPEPAAGRVWHHSRASARGRRRSGSLRRPASARIAARRSCAGRRRRAVLGAQACSRRFGPSRSRCSRRSRSSPSRRRRNALPQGVSLIAQLGGDAAHRPTRRSRSPAPTRAPCRCSPAAGVVGRFAHRLARRGAGVDQRADVDGLVGAETMSSPQGETA